MPESEAVPARLNRRRRRGEPLVILLTVLVVWTVGRGLVWQDLSLAVSAGKLAEKREETHPQAIAPHAPAVLPLARLSDRHGIARTARLPALLKDYSSALPKPLTAERRLAKAAGRGGGDSMLFVASDEPASEIVVPRQKPAPAGTLRDGLRMRPPTLRWSGDGWLLMRQGGASHALVGGGAPYGPTYGANQIGAVLRYRLLPGEAHRLTAYMRAYGALNGTGESEVASGLSLRPVPVVPVVAMAEMRASRFPSGKVHARPAVTLVSEMPPLPVVGRVEFDSYMQAGYVGGAASTAFIDGQMRVEQVLNRSSGVQWRLGLGAWGGAQTGANRLDIGPTLRVGRQEGGMGARLAVDYRLRVKGNALPRSGPAITLSAGF